MHKPSAPLITIARLTVAISLPVSMLIVAALQGTASTSQTSTSQTIPQGAIASSPQLVASAPQETSPQQSSDRPVSDDPVCKVINVDNLPATPGKYLNIPADKAYPLDRSLSNATATSTGTLNTIILREGPGHHYAPLHQLQAGEALTITFHAYTWECHSWYRVENAAGQIGWLNEDNITLSGDNLTR